MANEPETLKKNHDSSYQYTDYEGDKLTVDLLYGSKNIIFSLEDGAVCIPVDVLLDILDRLGVEVVPTKENVY